MKKLTAIEVESKIKNLYPYVSISLKPDSYTKVNAKAVFNVNGQELVIRPGLLLQGTYKFRQTELWNNPTKNNNQKFIDTVISITEQKHPELKGTIHLSLVEYINNKVNATLIFNGQEFKALPSSLIKNGLSLKVLKKPKVAINKVSAEDILKRIQEGTHKVEPRPFISFNVEDYKDLNTRIFFEDQDYGKWLANPKDVVYGSNHPERAIASRIENQMLSIGDVKKRLKEGYENENESIAPRPYLTLDESTYVDTRTNARFIDSEFGEFWAKPNHVFFGQEHSRRIKAKSRHETEMAEWLESLGFKVLRNFKIKENGISKEIDLYIEDKKVGIEINGLYWHNETKKPKKYHLDKRIFFENVGISVFQINEDEWNFKKDLVKSIILNKLGASPIKLMARKGVVKKVSQKEAKDFLEKNHLMGYSVASFIGLYINNELVSLLTYQRFKTGDLEVARFCNKKNTSVSGSFSKLLKASINADTKRVISWVDLRYGTGASLLNLGFNLLRTSLGFKWTDNRYTFNRRHCRANMDHRQLSENDMAKELGLFRIFDAGQALYGLNIDA